MECVSGFQCMIKTFINNNAPFFEEKLLPPLSSTVLTHCSPKLTSELIRLFQAVDTGSPDTPLEVFGQDPQLSSSICSSCSYISRLSIGKRVIPWKYQNKIFFFREKLDSAGFNTSLLEKDVTQCFQQIENGKYCFLRSSFAHLKQTVQY
ncbi:hypothetical protein TNIN_415681 [Trichonephila inaurata madagascariensis]|uniref:Uncharacterized protein n=1 Tax=Trichonephila inaurata madagascariensis TaxID=2747483 RepID=A0A8X6IJR1_9ARAC|nr:hypothetical protein TNIN_415681 [Trichonephila inaurata madagascariensis]